MSWYRAVGQLARAVRRIPPRELLTTARAGLLLIGVEIGLRRLRLQTLARWCGVRLDFSPRSAASPVALGELPERTQRAVRAARRVTRRWPFSSGSCLRRALVGGHLIRDLRPTIRIGVADRDGAIAAHAWLELDGRPMEDVDTFVAFSDSSAPATDTLDRDNAVIA